MSDDKFKYDIDVIRDLRRLRELDIQACSGKGITLDESIERKDLQIKFNGRDVLSDLIDMAERYLGGS